MSFEIEERDLSGRIGKFHTRRGPIETPYLMPVVNPVRNSIPPDELKKEFGFGMIITNSYIILKHYKGKEIEIHDLTGFQGPIMTDSGAYQLLTYGDIDTSPEEIVKFQEMIGSDIGVILDIPTGGHATREEAEFTVEETIRRAEQSVRLRKDSTMQWAGPIQGGKFLDLVERSAKRMGALEFDTHPLGSPTQLMEEYDYTTLVDMIVTAKKNLPPERPLHLFGAGHPMMLSLAVALGCDLFDSAAYALFAKDGRYMTTTRTMRLEELTELPCSCPVCNGRVVDDFFNVPKSESQDLLARHNLYVTMQEIKMIKQAIREGSLWELLEVRCRSHPRLYEAFQRLSIYSDYLEKNDPVLGKRARGIFLYDKISFFRPEVIRHRQRMFQRYKKPEGKDILVLLPYPTEKPFNRSGIYLESKRFMAKKGIHFCFYGEPFGVVPEELAETFPLSQFESSIAEEGLDEEKIISFLERNNYRKAIMVSTSGTSHLRGVKLVESLNKAMEEV
jgi:7-cyano-7-deazaguanine tRNA-ribosyltransferase